MMIAFWFDCVSSQILHNHTDKSMLLATTHSAHSRTRLSANDIQAELMRLIPNESIGSGECVHDSSVVIDRMIARLLDGVSRPYE